MSRDKLSCYVLMSFDGKYDFVFEAIKDAASIFSNKHNIILDVNRADLHIETRKNKIEEIKQKIIKSSFCVIDFSGLRPNIMWELGFCQCLQKHIIPITESDESIPFNIQGMDFCKYKFSVKGIEELKEKLLNCFIRVWNDLNSENSFMINDPNIHGSINDISSHLGQVQNSSLTRELVSYEVERLARRVQDLKHGIFDLRNEKPIDEVIKFYCDYLEQLKGPDCKFLTVTCSDFWREITEDGQNFEYIEANKKAVKNGAKICRVFVLNKNTVNSANNKFNKVINAVLDSHFEIMEDLGRENFSVKLIETSSPERNTYKNFGILYKSDEKLLFTPVYNSDNELVRTDFIYNKASKSQQTINSAERKFSEAFGRSEWLNRSLIQDICQ